MQPAPAIVWGIAAPHTSRASTGDFSVSHRCASWSNYGKVAGNVWWAKEWCSNQCEARTHSIVHEQDTPYYKGQELLTIPLRMSRIPAHITFYVF